nr:nucleotidyltransferase domain-containing protein [Candidatus Bathyarchaeota archaeon]
MVVLLLVEGVNLARLPDKLRLVLERIVRSLSRRETVSGVGLFGSWSRGDAAVSSDVDLLVVDGRDFKYEYVARVEYDDFLVDLNYIPKKWVRSSVPPELDQKLYEMV